MNSHAFLPLLSVVDLRLSKNRFSGDLTYLSSLHNIESEYPWYEKGKQQLMIVFDSQNITPYFQLSI